MIKNTNNYDRTYKILIIFLYFYKSWYIFINNWLYYIFNHNKYILIPTFIIENNN
jgi:hypothetical protein